MNENLPNGVLRRGHAEIEFVDQYGEKRTLHRLNGNPLRVKRKGNTVVHALNRVVGFAIGRRIRELRIARGWSLDFLAHRAGLAAGAGQYKDRMWEIENSLRQHGVKHGTLYAIAIALGVPVCDLLPSADDVAKAAGCELNGDPVHVRIKP